MFDLVQALQPQGDRLQWRQATVVSIEAGDTCTVTLAGTTISGVRYMTPPRPGGSVWCMVQGGNVQVVGGFANQTDHPTFIGTGSATSLVSGVWTTLLWTYQQDTWGMDSVGEVALPADGVWHVSFSGQSATVSTTGTRFAAVQSDRSGSWAVEVQDNVPGAAFQQSISLVWAHRLVKGTKIRVAAYQNSAASQGLANATLCITWLGF